MKIRMINTDVGDGHLTTEHSASSYGQPVFVADDGAVYGPGDLNGYLHKVDGVEYTPEALQWVHDYIVRTHLKDCVRHGDGMDGRWLVWICGATWKTTAQLAEIERRNGERMIRV